MNSVFIIMALYLFSTLLAYGLKVSDQFSRLWSTYWLGSTILTLACINPFLSHRQRAGRKILVGEEKSLDLHRQAIARHYQEGAVIALTFETALEWLKEQTEVCAGDELLLIGQLPGDAERTALILALHGHPVALRYCLDLEENLTVPLLPTVGLLDDILKRAEDIILGSLALLVSAPVMILAAACVRCSSPGPVLFRQRRLGLGGKAFTILKFRTMAHQAGGDPQARQADLGQDARVTPVGALLRRWGLDELPQLLNVLMGDMSLVGPRPHAFPHDVEWGQRLPRYGHRFRVRPGITGLAQISGRRGYVGTIEDIEQRVTLDLEYIRTWSLWLDLKIMAGTVPALIRDEGQARGEGARPEE